MLRQNLDLSHSIFALVSGGLPCAVASMRLSGPDAFSISEKVFSPSDGGLFRRQRGMYFGTLSDRQSRKIDEVVVLVFAGPASFTGEDTVEFQCHGSVPILRRLELVLLELGARPAQKGEFSYRAYLNGKLDSGAVEELGDVFRAREAGDLDLIYARRDGSVQSRIGELRSRLLSVQAILDTAVDFSEEYSSVVSAALPHIEGVIRDCSAITRRYSAFREGVAIPRVVLAGSPNAGKSSLFNAILCRYRAIVDSTPGTTRDVIEDEITLAGRRCHLVDTAGFRNQATGAEKEGMSLGDDYLSASVGWVLVVDGTKGFSAEDWDLLERHRKNLLFVAWNKSDSESWRVSDQSLGFPILPVSAKTGDRVDQFTDTLSEQLKDRLSPTSALLPTAIQSSRLEKALSEMESLREEFLLLLAPPPEVLAEHNRQATALLDRVVGEIGTDEVLGRIFEEFCIGK